MKTVDLFDISNTEHTDFLYELVKACRDEFYNDYQNDAVLIIADAERRLRAGIVKAFLAIEDGGPIGILWVEIDRKGVGLINIGVLPAHRNAFKVMFFLKKFVTFCFNTLELRKLKYEFNQEYKGVEVLLRRLGFKKEGYFKSEYTKDGKPINEVRIGLLKNGAA